MNHDIIDINDFTVLEEESTHREPTMDCCKFDEPIIGVAFYGSGNVGLTVKYGNHRKEFNHTKKAAKTGLGCKYFSNTNLIFRSYCLLNMR